MEPKTSAPSSALVASSVETSVNYRQATDVANLCREIVLATVCTISQRRYVRVEGWSAIAVAHGCIVTVKSVEETEKGVLAVVELRRQSDGAFLSSAEGFVGRDESTWYGGQTTRWNKFKKPPGEETVTLPKRLDYAIRAMAQTRGISRVCRTAFSHVVVLIDKGLSTVPYEEISANEDAPEAETSGTGAEAGAGQQPPPGGAGEKKPVEVNRDEIVKLRAQFEGGKWKAVKVHFGKNGPNGENAVAAKKPQGLTLGELSEKSLGWFIENYEPKPFEGRPVPDEDKIFRAALDAAGLETK